MTQRWWRRGRREPAAGGPRVERQSNGIAAQIPSEGNKQTSQTYEKGRPQGAEGGSRGHCQEGGRCGRRRRGGPRLPTGRRASRTPARRMGHHRQHKEGATVAGQREVVADTGEEELRKAEVSRCRCQGGAGRFLAYLTLLGCCCDLQSCLISQMKTWSVHPWTGG
jgi:hypothetical protein